MRNLKKIVNNPYVILCTYLISVAGLIVSIYTINQIAKYVVSGFIGCYIVGLTIYIIKRYFSAKIFKKNILRAQKEHNKNFANDISEIVNAVIRANVTINNSKFDDNTSKLTLDKVCNKIREFMTTYVGDTGVCIKSICTDSLLDSDRNKWSTTTIARDCKNLTARSLHDKEHQKIEENTSFKDILETQKSWATKDLKETAKKYKELGKEYRNPDRDYLKYYNSTIVVPICTIYDNIAEIIKEKTSVQSGNAYHILGFLCIDSQTGFKAEYNEFEEIVNTVTIIGNALYLLLENILTRQLQQLNNK